LIRNSDIGNHHAGGHRALEAERVADGDDELADPQPPRITEPGEGRRLAFEAQDGEIGIGIVTHQVRREAAPVGKGGLDLAGTADDVAVGQHIGVGGEDNPGARTAGAILEAADLEVQDRRADPVDGADDRARIGVKQCQILRRAKTRRRRGAGLDVAADGIVDGIVDGGQIGHIGCVHGEE